MSEATDVAPGRPRDPARRAIMATRTRPIAVITALCLLAAFVLPAVPQAPSYHDFADHRPLLVEWLWPESPAQLSAAGA